MPGERPARTRSAGRAAKGDPPVSLLKRYALPLKIAAGVLVVISLAVGVRWLVRLPENLRLAEIQKQGGDYRAGRTGEVDYVFFEGPAVGDAQLAELAADLPRLRALTRVQLLKTSVTGAGLSHLKSIPRLTALDLTGSSVDDGGLPAVAGHKELGSLLLAGTKISSDGLPTLVPLAKLRVLDLSSTAVDDRGLMALVPLASLRSLRVTGSRVTAWGVARFRAARSDVVVTF